jgi:hypothetical protein
VSAGILVLNYVITNIASAQRGLLLIRQRGYDHFHGFETIKNSAMISERTQRQERQCWRVPAQFTVVLYNATLAVRGELVCVCMCVCVHVCVYV